MDGHGELAKLLLEHGAKPDAEGLTHGTSPLILAAGNGLTDVVAALLDRGADVNWTSQDGLTPIKAAADAGHDEVVTLLRKVGAP